MDKEQRKTMALFGYSVEELPNMKTTPKTDYYNPKGVLLKNLPADPYHMNKYLGRGFTLEPPTTAPTGYKCEICDKEFSAKIGLIGHMRS